MKHGDFPADFGFLEGDNDTMLTLQSGTLQTTSAELFPRRWVTVLLKPNMISGFRKKNNMQQKQMERLNTWCALWDCREWSFNHDKVWFSVKLHLWDLKIHCSTENEWISHRIQTDLSMNGVFAVSRDILKNQATPHQPPNYKLTIIQAYYEWIMAKRDAKNAKRSQSCGPHKGDYLIDSTWQC